MTAPLTPETVLRDCDDRLSRAARDKDFARMPSIVEDAGALLVDLEQLMPCTFCTRVQAHSICDDCVAVYRTAALTPRVMSLVLDGWRAAS